MAVSRTRSSGTWLATAGAARLGGGMVRIWDTASRTQRATPTIDKGGVNAIAIVPDGNWLAIGGNDGGRVAASALASQNL